MPPYYLLHRISTEWDPSPRTVSRVHSTLVGQHIFSLLNGVGPGYILMCVHIHSLQSCLTLCNPMDYSLPGSSVHGFLKARIVEWVAMPSSRASSQPRDRTPSLCLLHWQVNSLPLAPPRKPRCYTATHGY